MDEEFDLSQLSPEELEQLIALGSLGDEMGIVAKQQELADALRYGAGPEGRDTGRIYTAANPLEHIGSAMQKYNAMKESKGLQERQKGILEQSTDARKLYADLLRRRKPGAAPVTPDPFDSYSQRDY